LLQRASHQHNASAGQRGAVCFRNYSAVNRLIGLRRQVRGNDKRNTKCEQKPIRTKHESLLSFSKPELVIEPERVNGDEWRTPFR
jgi:hypothetical protein